MKDSPVLQTPRQRAPEWLIIVLSAVGGIVLLGSTFAAIIVIVLFSVTNEPVSVSDEFVSLVQSNNVTEAYSLTSDSFKAATSEETLNARLSNVNPLIQGEAVITNRGFNKIINQPGTTVVTYTVKSSPETYLKVTLTEQDDSWHVSTFSSSETPFDTKIE